MVVEAVRARRLRVSAHALREAEIDQLAIGEIEVASCAGECIEDYPDDPRGSSCLVLGQVPDRGPVHALWGFDPPSRHAILITVYLPDPQRWSGTFERGDRAMPATPSQCFRCGSAEVADRSVEELVHRGSYVVALRLVAGVCANCGERYLQRDDVAAIEDVRRRLDRGELDGFRVTGELLEPAGSPR